MISAIIICSDVTLKSLNALYQNLRNNTSTDGLCYSKEELIDRVLDKA